MPSLRCLSGPILTLALIWPAVIQAGESRVELTDGSIVTGEFMGIEAGRYRIRSASLGDLWIPESSVRSLRPGSDGDALPADAPGASVSATSDYAAEIASLQRQIVTDQGLLERIMALQQDPEIQTALSDPELSRLILSGDLERLRTDDRFQRFLTHPSIQAILGQAMGR